MKTFTKCLDWWTDRCFSSDCPWDGPICSACPLASRRPSCSVVTRLPSASAVTSWSGVRWIWTPSWSKEGSIVPELPPLFPFLLPSLPRLPSSTSHPLPSLSPPLFLLSPLPSPFPPLSLPSPSPLPPRSHPSLYLFPPLPLPPRDAHLYPLNSPVCLYLQGCVQCGDRGDGAGPDKRALAGLPQGQGGRSAPLQAVRPEVVHWHLCRWGTGTGEFHMSSFLGPFACATFDAIADAISRTKRALPYPALMLFSRSIASIGKNHIIWRHPFFGFFFSFILSHV